MKKINFTFILVLIFLLNFYNNTNAQGFNYKWGKHAGGKNLQEGKAVCFDTKGNVIVGGDWQDKIDFNPPNLLDTSIGIGIINNVFVTKYNQNGEYQWRFVLKSIGYSGVTLSDLETDLQDNIIIGGNYSASFDLDPDPLKTKMATVNGISNAFIAKYDKNGKYLWSILLKNAGAFSNSVKDLETDIYNNVYVTGNFQQSVDFDPDSIKTKNVYGSSNSIYITKYSSAGKFLDMHFFYCEDANYSYPTDIAIDKAGNAFVTGNLFSNTFAVNGFAYPYSPNIMGKGYGDIFLIKLNSNLDPSWWFAISSTDTEKPTALALDDSSNIYLTGDFTLPIDMDPSNKTWLLSNPNPYPPRQLFIAKYDSSSNLKWAKNFSGKGTIGAGIDLDANRNIYVGFVAADTVWLNPELDKTFVFTVGGGQGFAKLNPNGKGLFGNIYLGQNIIQEQANIDVDPFGNLAFTNKFFSSLDLDFSNISKNINTVDYYDAFTAVYSTCSAYGNIIMPKILSKSDSLCSGDSMRLFIFNKGYDQILWSNGKKDSFITIYNEGTYKVFTSKNCNYPMSDSIIIRKGNCPKTSIYNLYKKNTLTLYPNPAKTNVNISVIDLENINIIKIYDIKGIPVNIIELNYPSSNYDLNIAALSNGTYLLQLITNKTVYYQKLVIEN